MTPDQIKRLYAKSLAAQNAGKHAEAAKGYAKLLRANPRLAEPHFQMARIAALKPDFETAAHHFEAALKLRPSELAIWLAYFDLASRHPNTSLLVRLLARAGKLDETAPGTAFFRGLAAVRDGQTEKGRALLERAAEGGWPDPRGLTELADQLGTREALAVLDRALSIAAGDAVVIARKCDLLRNMGRFDEARALARDGLAQNPQAGGLYYSYASIARLDADDPVISQMKKLHAARKLAGHEAIFLNTALAKAAQDTGKVEQVFAYLRSANKVNEKLYPYDFAKDKVQAHDYREVYAGFAASGIRCPLATGPSPVFVTGMPRSGTTLIEQIIASHSSVSGGGELGLLGRPLTQALGAAPDWAALGDQLGQAAQGYLNDLDARFAGARVVTDKSISTYAPLGFVKAALPQARIIMVRRDPRDNALSIYKNLFAFGQHRYATNLRNIARFFRLFEDQVAFWADQLETPFHQISYEKLIAEPEAQSRALIDACGLAWEDSCLSFYETDRRVDTLSSAQVRQPIYSSSSGAWRAFEKELKPFTEEYQRLGGVLA